MLEYVIIPISFRDYNEYVDCLNYHGKYWCVFSIMLRTYNDSPMKGVTTHEFICYRKKRWWGKE